MSHEDFCGLKTITTKLPQGKRDSTHASICSWVSNHLKNMYRFRKTFKRDLTL